MINIEKQKNYGLFFSATVIIAYLFSAIIGAPLLKLGDYGIVANAVQPILITGLCVLFVKKSGEKLSNVFPVKKINLLAVLSALLCFIGLFFGIGRINVDLSEFLQDIGVNVGNTEFKVKGAWHYIVSVLSLSVAPSVGEELLFRGVLLFALCNYCGKVDTLKKQLLTCVISGVLFALFHKNLAQIIYQFCYGFILSALVIRAQNIILAMIMHALNNFIILTHAVCWGVEIYTTKTFVIGLLSLFIGLILLLLFVNPPKAENSKEKLDFKEILIYLSLSVIFCVVAIILVNFL